MESFVSKLIYALVGAAAAIAVVLLWSPVKRGINKLRGKAAARKAREIPGMQQVQVDQVAAPRNPVDFEEQTPPAASVL